MEYSVFKKELSDGLRYIEVTLNENQIKQIYEFMLNLIEWNEKINLTAIKNEKDIIVKHFIDSIYVQKYINGKVLDIGSGAGFPGIPIKISDNSLDIVSIDSVNKKINFQKDAIQKLNLLNFEALHVRAEDLAKDLKYRENFDFVVSRAVSNMSTLVEYMLPFVKVGGICICMKGPNPELEINESKKAIEVLGGKIDKVEKYRIDNENERTLVFIKKINKTPNVYPRGQGKPLKNPLK